MILFSLLFITLTFVSSCSKKSPEHPLGRDQEEFLYLEQRAKKNPGNTETYLDLGEAYIILGQLKEAEECFIKILKIHKHLPPAVRSEAHRRLGNLYLNSNRYDKSQDEIRIIKKTFPWERSIFDMQGHYWYKMHKHDKGIGFYASELANSTCTDTFVGMGNTYQASGEHNKAESIYRAGNVFDRECPFVSACLANLLASQKKYKETEKLLRLSISKDPELGEFYVYMGNLKRQTGKLHEAIKWYKKALKIDRRSNEYAYAELGNTYIILAEKEREISLPLQITVTFLIFLTVSMIAFIVCNRMKNSGMTTDKRKLITGTILLVLLTLIIFEAAGLWLLNGNNPVAKQINPRSFYYYEAVDAINKAININHNRKDLRTNLAKAFRGIHKVKDAQAEEAMAKLLPEYDLHARLRFIYP